MKVPGSQIDFADSPDLQTSVTISDETDVSASIVVPIILVILTLPATITRVAMRGMDCVMVRKDIMDQAAEQKSIKQEVQRARNGVSCRLAISISFGGLGVSVSAAVILAIIFLIFFLM